MAQEKQGIKELKELTSFVVALVQAIVSSLEDGKVGLSDLWKLFAVLRKAAPAFKNVAAIRLELADLSDAEKDELRKLIEEEFDLSNNVLEGFIEEALKAAISLLDLIQVFQVKEAA